MSLKRNGLDSITSKICVTKYCLCAHWLEAPWDVPILWSVLSASVKQSHKWEEARDKCRTPQL